MPTEYQREFAIDQGELASAVYELLRKFSAAEWVEATADLERRVIIFKATGLRPESWSYGERLIWQFCLSLAGADWLALREFTMFFRSGGMKGPIAACWAAAMGMTKEIV